MSVPASKTSRKAGAARGRPVDVADVLIGSALRRRAIRIAARRGLRAADSFSQPNSSATGRRYPGRTGSPSRTPSAGVARRDRPGPVDVAPSSARGRSASPAGSRWPWRRSSFSRHLPDRLIGRDDLDMDVRRAERRVEDLAVLVGLDVLIEQEDDIGDDRPPGERAAQLREGLAESTAARRRRRGGSRAASRSRCASSGETPSSSILPSMNSRYGCSSIPGMRRNSSSVNVSPTRAGLAIVEGPRGESPHDSDATGECSMDETSTAASRWLESVRRPILTVRDQAERDHLHSVLQSIREGGERRLREESGTRRPSVSLARTASLRSSARSSGPSSRP